MANRQGHKLPTLKPSALTSTQWQDIAERLKRGQSIGAIARLYGIKKPSLYNACETRGLRSSAKAPPITPENTKFRIEMVEQAKQLALLGANDIQIATFFKVTDQTFINWKKKEPMLARALDEGRVLANAKVAKSMFERANGYEHEDEQIFLYQGEPVRVKTTKRYPPETQAGKFWLTNKAKDQGWKDVSRSEVSGPDGGPIQAERMIDLSDLTREERDFLEGIIDKSTGGSESG